MSGRESFWSRPTSGWFGDYTARLVRESLALRAESGPGPLVCLGRRAVSPLAKAGVQPVSVQPAPTSVAGLTGLLLPVAAPAGLPPLASSPYCEAGHLRAVVVRE